jgi:WD40 repeat protein
MDVAGSGSRKRYDAFISYAHHADEAFAPVLQRGLQHLAKPWNSRRAMDVFLDETSLAASSGLEPSIWRALDASRWFVLLASPESARSDWVNDEITYWVSSKKGAGQVLVVVTEGTWIWDKTSGDIDPASTAGNPALNGAFGKEPLYVDMTWARHDASLTLRNPRFRDQIATLAAAIREEPKEDIESEDVRQQRRTRRIVRAVIATLTVLVVLASGLAIVANIQRQHADYQASFAASNELAAESEQVDGTDIVTAAQLAAASWNVLPSAQARASMLQALARSEVATFDAVSDPQAHQGGVYEATFSPDGAILATAGDDGTARLWNVATHQQIGAPITAVSDPSRNGVTGVAFSPDGTILATAGDDGTARLWNVATHRKIGAPITAVSDPSKDAVYGVAFGRDGTILATAGGDGTARLWDVATHQQIGAPITVPSGASAVAFSPDGTILAIAGRDGTARLWNVATRQEIRTPITAVTDPDVNGVNAVTFSPNGSILATTGADGTVRLWDVATGRQIGAAITAAAGGSENGGANGVAFSPDGSMLATAGGDGTMRLWDVATHQQIGAAMTAANLGYAVLNNVNAVAFSPDGKILASAGNDGTVRLWDVATQQQIGASIAAVNQIGAQGVNAMAFSPDGSILATVGGDGLARLWDVATHQQIGASITTVSDPKTYGGFGVAFSPDGKILATGGGDGTARLWDVGFPGDLLDAVCAVAGTSLTPLQWDLYVQTEPYRKVC